MARKKGSVGLAYLGMHLPVDVVQPNIESWRQIKLGMSCGEVTRILGNPLKYPCVHNPSPDGLKIDIFGYFQMPLIPDQLWFGIQYFNEIVVGKMDPFYGDLSSDGKPVKPIIISPPNEASFPPSVNLIDIRWLPVSGEYPMTYDLQFGSRILYDKEMTLGKDIRNIPIPFYVVTNHGFDLATFRVRGVNELGEGEWSEYCYISWNSPKQKP